MAQSEALVGRFPLRQSPALPLLRNLAAVASIARSREADALLLGLSRVLSSYILSSNARMTWVPDDVSEMKTRDMASPVSTAQASIDFWRLFLTYYCVRRCAW